MRWQLILLCFILAVSPIQAQWSDSHGEEITDQPRYRGEVASVPIPPEMHLRNQVDAGGSGLCVPTSVTMAGRYQGVPALQAGKESLFYRTAKAANNGGFGPDQLIKLIEKTVPGEPYGSYTGTDFTIMDKLSRAGYPMSATMSTGSLYGYKTVHHFVNPIHYRKDGWTCIVDNNDIGHYYWMPSPEYQRRALDNGMYWVFWWTRHPAMLHAVLLPFAAAFLFFVTVRRRSVVA